MIKQLTYILLKSVWFISSWLIGIAYASIIKPLECLIGYLNIKPPKKGE